MVSVEKGHAGVIMRIQVQESLSRMSEKMYEKTLNVFETWIKAGEADLMEGYSSSICMTDFLHSAGLITDRAYESVFLLSTIMASVSTLGAGISAIFGGASPLAPTLRTRVEQKGDKGKDDEGDAADAAQSAQALAGTALSALELIG